MIVETGTPCRAIVMDVFGPYGASGKKMTKDNKQGTHRQKLRYGVLIQDEFTRFIQIHCASESNSETICKALMKWVSTFSLFTDIKCDRASYNISKAMELFYAKVGVTAHYSAAHHAESHG